MNSYCYQGNRVFNPRPGGNEQRIENSPLIRFRHFDRRSGQMEKRGSKICVSVNSGSAGRFQRQGLMGVTGLALLVARGQMANRRTSWAFFLISAVISTVYGLPNWSAKFGPTSDSMCPM
jgi:hypothetical protein